MIATCSEAFGWADVGFAAVIVLPFFIIIGIAMWKT